MSLHTNRLISMNWLDALHPIMSSSLNCTQHPTWSPQCIEKGTNEGYFSISALQTAPPRSGGQRLSEHLHLSACLAVSRQVCNTPQPDDAASDHQEPNFLCMVLCLSTEQENSTTQPFSHMFSFSSVTICATSLLGILSSVSHSTRLQATCLFCQLDHHIYRQ